MIERSRPAGTCRYGTKNDGVGFGVDADVAFVTDDADHLERRLSRSADSNLPAEGILAAEHLPREHAVDHDDTIASVRILGRERAAGDRAARRAIRSSPR